MNSTLREAILQNGFLAKITAMIVLLLFSVTLSIHITHTEINSDVIQIMTAIIAFTAGFLFSKRDKKE